MRNKIYRYALINENCITLTDSNCNQPALLRTCRQIRTEASMLFYSQNKFQLEASQPLQTRGLPHVLYWLWTMPGREEFGVFVEGNIEWYPFKRWLQLIHRGLIHVMEFFTERDDVDDVLNQGLSIAKDYKGLPWSVTAYQLEAFRQRKGMDPGVMSPSALWG
jgi:hypothetical protein